MNITERQVVDSILAIPAFVPAAVCPGYLVAWATNLHGFRDRSVVERMFWSLPLSLALSTISSVLIGWFVSLTADVLFFVASSLLFLVVVAIEWRQRRRSSWKRQPGVRPPIGFAPAVLAVFWVVVAVLSLIDVQRDRGLSVDLAALDQGFRVNWTSAILHTGVPPVNPLYWYKHAASMRNYYFWYIVCAALARLTRLPPRAVLAASSVWAGLSLGALIFLYVQEFLKVGVRIRQQYPRCLGLLFVTGLDICPILWKALHLHGGLSLDGEVWSKTPIISWFDTLVCAPHHIASLICCMLALLLAWLLTESRADTAVFVPIIACSLASAFGLSVYVAFAFFLVMMIWGLWQIGVERRARPILVLLAGGAGALLLLIPYLRQLTTSNSGMQAGRAFEFTIREMLPAEVLLQWVHVRPLALLYPTSSASLARLILLAPGYFLELGFYFVVLLIFLIPAWRERRPLTAAQRSLLVISVATLIVVTFLQSGTLSSNDFGWRGALLSQFALLLLGSELLIRWRVTDQKPEVNVDYPGLPGRTPYLVRAVASFGLILGALSTLYQAMMFRFTFPIADASFRASHSPNAGVMPHNAYISAIGYAKLNRSISDEAIVQYNPANPGAFSAWQDAVDELGVSRQVAIAGDKPWCGAEFGGDPSGCLPMAAAIDALYKDASAEQARATCRQIGIQYLIARVYDPPWNDKNSWVWALPPVVADPEFRAVDCR